LKESEAALKKKKIADFNASVKSMMKSKKAKTSLRSSVKVGKENMVPKQTVSVTTSNASYMQESHNEKRRAMQSSLSVPLSKVVEEKEPTEKKSVPEEATSLKSSKNSKESGPMRESELMSRKTHTVSILELGKAGIDLSNVDPQIVP
jgi:hypothetical protein